MLMPGHEISTGVLKSDAIWYHAFREGGAEGFYGKAADEQITKQQRQTMKRIVNLTKWALGIRKRRSSQLSFAALFKKFQEILSINNRVLELIAGANDKLGGDYVFDQQYIHATCKEVSELVQKLIYNLDSLAPKKYSALLDAFYRIQQEINGELEGRMGGLAREFILSYEDVSRDLLEAVGAKNAHLIEVRTVLGLRTPDGFAITAAAFHAFMEENGLRPLVEEITSTWVAGEIDTAEASARIQSQVMAARLPERLKKELAHAVEHLTRKSTAKTFFLAVRSSAWGEDGEHTFAGQYMTRLNVPVADLADSYLQVLASAYSETAMEYRRRQGYSEKEVTMSVACQEMIDAMVSGVLYTINPLAPDKDTMLLSATWGLGTPVVSGRAVTDQFTIERSRPHQITEVKVVRKENALIVTRQGGTIQQQVPRDRQTSASLLNEQVKALVETGLQVEKYFKKPQDVEFCLDHEGKIIILQARPLIIKPQAVLRSDELVRLVRKYPVIFRDKGMIAQKGIAAGPVFLINNDKDLDEFPAGAILVTKYASPLLAKAMMQAVGIITDVGAVTGHLANIAREFRVPCILNTGNATELLASGQEITIDAEENVIYRGIVKELRYYSLAEEDIGETFEYRLLRRVLKKIGPLHLLDPSEKNFVPAACQTLHDITRFVHEKAVEELINFNYYHRLDKGTFASKLVWDIPLDLIMIDVGGGLETSAKTILPEEICSVPMISLLKGLAQPGSWDNEPMSVDFGSFMSSLTRTIPPELSSPKYVGRNLAVVSREYANVSLRLGYHFTMIDAYISENINDNYAYFRFFGGVTEDTRRTRRAKFLGEILANNDFRVEMHGDLVVGRIKKLDAERMRQRLYLLGLLVGFTRQLDVQMNSEGHIVEFVKKFETLSGSNNYEH